MYLRRGTRTICWGVLAFGLLLTTGGVASAVSAKGDRRTGALVGVVIVASLFLLLPGIPLLLHYASGTRSLAPRRDILRDHLRLSRIAEMNGVQFVALPFPDEVHPPSHLGLAVFLQNGHDTPRDVELRVTQAPFRLVERQDPYRVRLAGGESGVLFVLGFAGPETQPGEHVIGYKVVVRRPGKIGRRVILAEEATRTGMGGGRTATLVVHPVRPLGETAAYPGLVERKGYQPVVRGGEETVREESLAFLNLPA